MVIPFALALCVAAAGTAACDRQTAESTDAAADVPPPDHDVPSLDSVREAHADAAVDEGVACVDDRDCTSPLRCRDAECLWPAALVGDTSGDLPRVVFHGERRAETTYTLEIASEVWERTRGLMHRRSMVRDMGMIFVFEDEVRRSFWMRETYIPLDMVFVTDAGVVDSFVENAEPLTDTVRPSDGPARYVVELNAGEVARMGLRPGSAVEFVGLPPELAPAGR